MPSVDILQTDVPVGFKYIHQFNAPWNMSKIKTSQCHLRVATVPLTTGTKNLGVFNVGTQIPAGAILGLYLGDVREGVQDDDDDSSYTFEVGRHVVDATSRGNWTRFVNGCSSVEVANVYPLDGYDSLSLGGNALPLRVPLLNHEVCYVTMQPIHSMEQLRMFYGTDYDLGQCAATIDDFATRQLTGIIDKNGGAFHAFE